jgi:isochorismate pyruvate lyase
LQKLKQLSIALSMTSMKKDTERKSAKLCTSMTEVRHEIDQLDKIIVELLSERVTYMDAAARIKGDINLVRDEARIEDVVNKVVEHSKKTGLAIEIIEPVYRLLIEKCIDYETTSFKRQYGDAS